MEIEVITLEPSSRVDDQDQSDQETSFNIRNKMKKASIQPTPLDHSCWSRNWPVIPKYAFGAFTGLSITIAVFTVYFTLSNKPNKGCELSFTRSIEYASVYNSHPRQIVAGDFNKDNNLDLVVSNSGSDCIGIFMGYGDGTFAIQVTYSTGIASRPYSVGVGDFNSDTELDIVVANYGTNSIGVLLADGNGKFLNPIITSIASSRPLSIAIADFDNDTQLDIAVANYGTLTVSILIGNNNGFFRIDQIYPMGFDSIPYSIAVADLNKDNILDLAVINYGTSELVIVLRNRNKSFEIEKYSTGFGSHPVSIEIKDLYTDNTLDIIVANSDTSNVGIFLGYGDGRFNNQITYSIDSDSRPQSLVINDFNNDAQLDIAVTDSSQNNVFVLKGNRNGSFSLITTHSTGYNSNPCSITVGHFDKDNRTDIAIANNGTGSIMILTSFYTYPTIIEINYTSITNSMPWSVDVADFNHDNYLDIVVPNHMGNTVGVFLNLGNGSFKDQQTYDMGKNSGPGFVTIGDLNNDNHSDIVVLLDVAVKMNILLGYGNGTFRNGNTYSMKSTTRIYTVSVGDFNDDNNLDIILSIYYPGNIGIFFGYGDGNFTDMSLLLPDGRIHPKCAEIGDFNNDNILDVAASDRDGGGIIIILGYGNGSFQDPVFISTANDFPNAFTVGDLNNDHLLDIVYSDTLFAHVGVLLGSGNGSFSNLIQYNTVHGSDPWFISLGYYNDDTLVDIAVGVSYDSSINIFMGIGHGLFGAPIRISTGYKSIPWSVMFADFDNDHQQDLVVANDQTDNILIFFVENYYADFGNESSYTTGSIPHSSSVSIADLNNDGQSDVIVVNSGNDNIELLFHYDNNIFINKTVLSTGHSSHPQCATIADFNRDHLLDIAIVNVWDDTMNVFLRLTDGSFDTKNVYSTGFESAPSSIAAGDFNKDGLMDIVIGNEGADNVAVFLAHDYVMFTNNMIYIPDILPRPSHIAIGDFNNDARLDIVATNFDNSVLDIFLGYGNGTFSDRTKIPIGSKTKPTALAVGDFNNDNYLDIVVTRSNASSIGVFLGSGNGNFQSQMIYSTGPSSKPYSVTVGDLNNDGQLDIAVANYDSNNVWICFGYGNGSFKGQIFYSMPTGSSPIWITISDIDNDTFLDIIVANFDASNIYILLGDGNGSVANVIKLSTGLNSGPCSLAIGDLNRDHSLDIIVANQLSKSIGIFFGYSNRTFSPQKIYVNNSNFYLTSIVVSDINNDKILDILVTDWNQFNSSIGILYGHGDGNFTLPHIYVTGSITLSKSILVADFDNDSRIDLAVTHYYYGSISIMLQQKFIPFASSELFSTGNHSHPKSITVGDFNNDDQLDIVVTNSGTNNIGIFLGYGNGKFANQLIYSTGTNSLPNSVSIGYFNHDHYLDIAVTNSAANNVGILLGYGNGTFANISTYSTGIISNPSCIAVADLNRDNHLDLVITNLEINNVLVFLGKTNGTFFEYKSYSLGYDAHPQSVAIGDLNNDNLLDIVVVNDGPIYIEIFLQTC